MDTILFFCKKRGIQEPVLEPIGMRSHLLIRIFLDVENQKWFGIKMVSEEEGVITVEEGDREKETESHGQSTNNWWKNLKNHGKKADSREKGEDSKKKNKERNTDNSTQNKKKYSLCWVLQKLFYCKEHQIEKRHQKEKEQEMQKALNQVEESIQKLISDILGMTGSWERCFCVYEDSIHRVLMDDTWRKNKMKNMICTQEEVSCSQERAILPTLWKKYFQIQEFTDYTWQLWVEEVMPEVVLPHFVILGMASCIPALIEKYADKMKSLRWIIPENDYSQELQEFMEDFYIEYGLAIMLQVVPAGQRRLQAVCIEPANILDFTKEARISLAKVAQGSIWLDMLSIEEKKRQIVGRSTGVGYFSLKEKWKLVRKKEAFVPWV